MKNFSAKNKIITLVAGWLILSVLMFVYFFKILDGKNQQALASMAQDRSNLLVLQEENESFKQAQSDLTELAGKTYQPDNFFSKDVSLVDEIQALEDLSQKYNLTMVISGVSGTVDSAVPAQTATPMVIIPYSISLSGSLQGIVDFMQNLENLPFVTTVTGVSITAGVKGQVNANLSANFYLRK